MKPSRRDFLKGAAAAGASLLTTSGFERREPVDQFHELENKVRKKRHERENNPGGTVYLGSVDSWDTSFKREILSDKENFELVEELLEKGETPEEIAENRKSELSSTAEDLRLFEERSRDVKLIHLSEDEERPLDHYAKELETAFEELEPSIDLKVEATVEEPDKEDQEHLESISSPDMEGLDADLQLKRKYAEDGKEPIFLLEENLLPDKIGVADYDSEVAFVELSDDHEQNIHVINHEAGHSILRLPHNFHEIGAMSYNPEAWGYPAFNERTRMMVISLLEGEIEYEVTEGSGSRYEDGEMEEISYKAIHAYQTPSNLDSEEVVQNFFTHLETYIEEELGHDMSGWKPSDYEHVENDGDSYDKAVYKHESGAKIEMKVDEYIQEMEFREPQKEEGV